MDQRAFTLPCHFEAESYWYVEACWNGAYC